MPLHPATHPIAVQLYLPPDHMLNKDFLKQVLAEEKQLLKKSEVVTRKVPQYEELAVKHIWPQFVEDEEMS